MQCQYAGVMRMLMNPATGATSARKARKEGSRSSIEAAVTGDTVQAMQFQVFFKLGQAHKPLERRLAHLPHILKTKMIRDQRFDLLDFII